MIKVFYTKLISYYRLYRNHVEINDFVIWESQGVIMWEEPKRLVYIDYYNGKPYGFVDGSLTGIPLKDLKKHE